MKYYTFSQAQGSREARIMIFGDITSGPYLENDVAAYPIVSEIEALDVDTIHVQINSYGGEVPEAWAIKNALTSHKAKIITYCYGVAASAAADLFMAGDERIVFPSCWLLFHDAWTGMAGNAAQLREAADRLEAISGLSVQSYRGKLTIDDETLADLLKKEAVITPEQALEWGFATAVYKQQAGLAVSASARATVLKRLMAAQKAQPTPPEPQPQLPQEQPTFKLW